MIKVKICGITNLEDALLASSFGADALGFIFSKKSPLYISEQAAKNIIDKLDPFVVKTGVFVDDEKEKVLDVATQLNLDVLQFHGKESPGYCHFFKHKFSVIKVFFLEDRPYKEKTSRYGVDLFMFDIKYEEKEKGKSIVSAEILKEITGLIKAGKRVIISGGLNIKNISKVIKISPYAVDVASGIEKLVGKKDDQTMKIFIGKAKASE